MLTISGEYLVAARKTGPEGAGTGQPPCVTGGSGRRGRRAGERARRPHWAADGLAAWLARTGGHGWLAGAGGLAGVGGRGRWRARRPGCLAALLGERRLLGHAGRGGGYTRLCRATDQGAAEPCHVSDQRFWSPPCQPSAAPPCMARHGHLAALGQ